MLAEPPEACLREAAIGATLHVELNIGVGLWIASLEAGRSNFETAICDRCEGGTNRTKDGQGSIGLNVTDLSINDTAEPHCQPPGRLYCE